MISKMAATAFADAVRDRGGRSKTERVMGSSVRVMGPAFHIRI